MGFLINAALDFLLKLFFGQEDRLEATKKKVIINETPPVLMPSDGDVMDSFRVSPTEGNSGLRSSEPGQSGINPSPKG